MKLSCTNCNQSLEIPDELLGQTVECPVCKIKFTAGQSSTNSVYDVKPLMALCEKILLDEEVSVEELYELAAFLNANPEAGKHWPGNQFVEPLQEVWADGVIDSRELALMERLIVETRREWRRRVAPMEKTEAPAEGGLTSETARINGPDIQMDVLAKEAERNRIEAESPLTPEPLRVRLLQVAEQAEQDVDQHHRERRYLPIVEVTNQAGGVSDGD